MSEIIDQFDLFPQLDHLNTNIKAVDTYLAVSKRRPLTRWRNDNLIKSAQNKYSENIEIVIPAVTKRTETLSEMI